MADDVTTADDRTIRWGIVSTGTIARLIAADLALLEHSEIAAVSSRSTERAHAFAAEFGVTRAYPSVEALLADPDVDVVHVATPHAQHGPVVRSALEAGKAVLVEKTFTTSLAETEDLVATARDRGVFCMEAMWTRFAPLIVQARAMVADGEIGEVRSVTAELGFVAPDDRRHRLWDPALGGGALLDVGVYPVAFAQMMLGAPQTVTAEGALTPDGVDAEAGLLLGWADGARAHLDATLRSPLAGAATIVGTTGRIEIPPRFHHPNRMLHVRAPRRGVETSTLHEAAAEGRGYVPMLRAVAQAVREGRTECAEMPLSDTVEIMRVLQSAIDQLGVSYPEPAAVPR